MTASHPELDWAVPAATPAMSLAGGTLRFERDERVLEDLAPGLKLVLVLDGELRYRVPGAPAAQVSGPLLHLSLCRDPLRMEHEFGARRSLRFVSLRTSLEHLRESLSLEPADIAGLLRAPRDGAPYADANLRLAAPLQALGRQMLACPMQGALKRMYLSAKALELTALALGALQPAPAASTPGGPSRADVERLHHARDLLLADLQHPPTLPELARRVGVNVNKLTTGFRQLFGCSVYACVREQRMAQAHALLAAGEMSVSEAAYACGYTDSHFSKAFQRRYGVLPRALIRGR
ncbi:AraC family transcriptional regulator [Achromobacter ruhlandii]|uniref:AraC family transcriptional regulator n=1 Tax=Achromobacter ruhlandii TaxID=72557 RepID=UPI001EEF086E|nr:AraC family transcriptional regulator [Achromobacter ruhlandii]MCV6798712.1 AraC family transcriptional regulator [Achromobacter ruhlandii]MCV6805449.1 AraC family transcriptional regulator [Achromobacter ruhlandii]MCV6811075.1 AraC family transcriptional regulator [Achromobacter ruhlandii]MCV6820777.1 AraC family transcriptional regulator [Achromobacter ruhlandii]MCZ8395625.1 AraC family transcriptional regulator [Achromobacter ruhlandii]